MQPNSPKIVALTGSIGSGKSTVAEILRRYGAEIIDADLLAREVVKPGTTGLQQVIEEFGIDILTPEGQLNRGKLADIIFSAPPRRKVLEGILHPLIHKEYHRELEQAKARSATRNGAPIIYVVPLFFESKTSFPEVSGVIVVSATKENCLKRLIARDGITESQALSRMQAQLPLETKVAKATWIINNDQTEHELEKQLEPLFKELSIS